MFSACTGTNIERYAEEKPQIDLKEYFDGEIRGWGIVQDWRGRVINRFDFDILGEWNGNQGVLDEEFVYYSGEKQNRRWRIESLGSWQISWICRRCDWRGKN